MELPPFLDVVISPRVERAARIAKLLDDTAEAMGERCIAGEGAKDERLEVMGDALAIRRLARAIRDALATRQNIERARAENAKKAA